MWRKDKVLGQFLTTVMVVGSVLGVLGGVQASQEELSQNKVQVIELFVLSGTAIIRLDTKVYPNIKAVVHVVDEEDQIKAGLNALTQKVSNEADARKLVQPYFQDPEFVARMKRAHLSKVQAKRYGLTAYPSAVINGGEGLVSGYVDMNVIVDVVEKGLKK